MSIMLAPDVIPGHLREYFQRPKPCNACYVCHMRTVARELWRVLRNDGTLWLNLGDSYGDSSNTGRSGGWPGGKAGLQKWEDGRTPNQSGVNAPGLKPKDLVGIPWRVALALQADGWTLRSDIIWCLSGGTWVYARTQKGDMPVMLRELQRLRPETVQLWNGEQWTRLRGMSRSLRKSFELELVLRSGERISCTPTHKFPTGRGLLAAAEIQVGDVLIRKVLPEPEQPKDSLHIGMGAAWLAGLYLAEGSMAGDTIQIACHVSEQGHWERCSRIAQDYGGSATRTIKGNSMDIRLYGKLLRAILGELVGGKTAKDKHFAPVVWRYSNSFIAEMLAGYLSGDGYWDEINKRWRLGFTRNYSLERDLRTAAARLNYSLTLNLSTSYLSNQQWPSFRGELRLDRSGHWNEKSREEVVVIRKARSRQFWDIEVEDEPHLFSLASGILTHNSKPNPMPESVRDRPTRAHEHVFLLAKQQRYYYDANAIREPGQEWEGQAGTFARIGLVSEYIIPGQTTAEHRSNRTDRVPVGRNRRTVWTIPTQPLPHSDYDKGHFATFPEALVVPMVLAGSKRGDIVLDPFAGSCTVGEVCRKLDRRFVGVDLSLRYLRELGLPRAEQQSTLESLQQLPLFAEHSEHPSSYDKTDTGREGYGAD